MKQTLFGNKHRICAVLFLYSVVLYADTFGHDHTVDDRIVIRENRYTKMGLQRYNRCIFYCKKALNFRKGYADAFYWMGNTFVSLGKPEHAETAFHVAVGHNPVHGPAWYNRGLVLHYEPGCAQEAAKCNHEALQIDPVPAGIKRHKALAEMQAADVINEHNPISR